MTKIIFVIIMMNLVTPKAGVKHGPFVQQIGLYGQIYNNHSYVFCDTLLCHLSQTYLFKICLFNKSLSSAAAFNVFKFITNIDEDFVTLCCGP